MEGGAALQILGRSPSKLLAESQTTCTIWLLLLQTHCCTAFSRGVSAPYGMDWRKSGGNGGGFWDLPIKSWIYEHGAQASSTITTWRIICQQSGPRTQDPNGFFVALFIDLDFVFRYTEKTCQANLIWCCRSIARWCLYMAAFGIDT